ncbi:hypothetical protein V475_07480 [Sphingobium baderi LL03]|uniref:Uncharacterized protein n=1 Tax=Sphingobium baderi LL03 TaxID=1114964 RepID=T0GRP8_9SPHN|nr:hypothetical protein L485_06620 [Sphingobium baderi LL03]KMS62675.1 hypothetical protein V475_07480 [Sphingobium baderi LL03]
MRPFLWRLLEWRLWVEDGHKYRHPSESWDLI